MAQDKLVIVISRGLDDERSSVAWSIANAGIASAMEVTVFLVASGVDWVRKGAADVAHLNPVDPPMRDLVGNIMSGGGRVLVCPPCAKVRGYSEEDLVDGVTVAGAPVARSNTRFENSDSLCFPWHSHHASRPLVWNRSLGVFSAIRAARASASSGAFRNATARASADSMSAAGNG